MGDLDRVPSHAHELVADLLLWFSSRAQLARVLLLRHEREEAEVAVAKILRLVPAWTPALHELGCGQVWRHDVRIVDAMCVGLRRLEATEP